MTAKDLECLLRLEGSWTQIVSGSVHSQATTGALMMLYAQPFPTSIIGEGCFSFIVFPSLTDPTYLHPQCRALMALRIHVVPCSSSSDHRTGRADFYFVYVYSSVAKTSQDELLAKYSFTCACPTCSLSKRKSKQSDIQRSVFLAVASKPPTAKDDYEVIEAWAANLKPPHDHIITHSLKIVTL